MYIYLNTFARIQEFVEIISQFDDDVDLKSGRHIVDAKSILGIFSLDLSRPVYVELYNSENKELIKQRLGSFSVTLAG